MTLTQTPDNPHRRWNPLLGEWILVSPHRTKRPWQGKVEDTPPETRPTYDPTCYLCPGNERAGGLRNPPYESTFVFQNDFSALLPDAVTRVQEDPDPLFIARPERGLCRVVCFSPRHDLTIARMEPPAIARVVDVWADQYAELGALDYINAVTIFENKGELMGCSNPHPHGQIWANESIPSLQQRELDAQRAWRRDHGNCLLCGYVDAELRSRERVLYENSAFVALVPFWAVWPFEIMIVSKPHAGAVTDFDSTARLALAQALHDVTARYDRLFNVSFPYSMGMHQRPTDGQRHDDLHFHMHFYPPLLRSATIRKFMVGYEMIAEPQRDITPEQAAERLRAV